MKNMSPKNTGRGVLQAGIPRELGPATYQPKGLLLRGVVTAVFEVDATDYPYESPVGYYCDVWVYSSNPAIRYGMLRRCIVSNEWGGMHDGLVRKPRATSLDVTGVLDIATANPANLDGDHVLVGFIDDNMHQPIVLRGIPHPATDVGQDNEIPGHRRKLKVVDGDPMFLKHHGSFFGVDTDGDFTVDTTQAYQGASLQPDGSQPTQTPGSGNVKLTLPAGATVTITVDGNNERHVTVAELLRAYLESVETWIKAHTHPTGMGPTTAPIESPTYPAYDANITSNKVAIPDNSA